MALSTGLPSITSAASPQQPAVSGGTVRPPRRNVSTPARAGAHTARARLFDSHMPAINLPTDLGAVPGLEDTQSDQSGGYPTGKVLGMKGSGNNGKGKGKDGRAGGLPSSSGAAGLDNTHDAASSTGGGERAGTPGLPLTPVPPPHGRSTRSASRPCSAARCIIGRPYSPTESEFSAVSNASSLVFAASPIPTFVPAPPAAPPAGARTRLPSLRHLLMAQGTHAAGQ
mmetsp:Transcript_2847/g.8689  ORF Transcript_2847/g.8689 Transcript_2847/m.8689 type:complete len:227 (+) Transcript_2847:106-786(+)